MKKIIQIISHNSSLVALDIDGNIWHRKQVKKGLVMQHYKWERFPLPKSKVVVPPTKFHFGIDTPENEMVLCSDFGLIKSIKFIRSECSCGLKEAKDACEIGTIKQAREALATKGYYR